jgi:hypothetical protein
MTSLVSPTSPPPPQFVGARTVLYSPPTRDNVVAQQGLVGCVGAGTVSPPRPRSPAATGVTSTEAAQLAEYLPARLVTARGDESRHVSPPRAATPSRAQVPSQRQRPEDTSRIETKKSVARAATRTTPGRGKKAFSHVRPTITLPAQRSVLQSSRRDVNPFFALGTTAATTERTSPKRPRKGVAWIVQ